MARLPVARLRLRSDGKLNWPGFWLAGWIFAGSVAALGALSYYSMGPSLFAAFSWSAGGSVLLSFVGPKHKRTGEQNNRAWIAGLGGAICAAFLAMAMHDLRALNDNGELESAGFEGLAAVETGRLIELDVPNHIAVYGSHSYRVKDTSRRALVVGIVPEGWSEGQPIPAWLSYGESEVPRHRARVLKRVKRVDHIAYAIRSALKHSKQEEVDDAPVFQAFMSRSQWADRHRWAFRLPLWMSAVWLLWVLYLRLRELGT